MAKHVDTTHLAALLIAKRDAIWDEILPILIRQLSASSNFRKELDRVEYLENLGRIEVSGTDDELRLAREKDIGLPGDVVFLTIYKKQGDRDMWDLSLQCDWICHDSGDIPLSIPEKKK